MEPFNLTWGDKEFPNFVAVEYDETRGIVVGAGIDDWEVQGWTDISVDNAIKFRDALNEAIQEATQ